MTRSTDHTASPDTPRWVAYRAKEVRYDETTRWFRVLPGRTEEYEYEPMTVPGLATAFARIAASGPRVAPSPRPGESRAAFSRRRLEKLEEMRRKEGGRFLQRYGRLGFWQTPGLDGDLWPESRRTKLMEPLDWIVAQARTVGFALDLIAGLQVRDRRAVGAALERLRTGSGPLYANSDSVPPRLRWDAAGRTSVRYAVAKGASYRGAQQQIDRSVPAKERPLPDYVASWQKEASYPLLGPDDENVFDHAGLIVADLVRFHLENLSYAFGWTGDQFAVWPARGSLLRAVWLQVQRAALWSRPVRHCEECGAPFVASDARQRFCPPEIVWNANGTFTQLGLKSACAARNQKRSQRHPEWGGKS